MSAMARSAGRSAPYGQACLSCFKTKCKCIPRLDGNGCERCHRLKRPCHPADVLRRRNDKQQNSSDDRIAKLEGAIGQLMSLLQAGNANVDIMNGIGDVGGIGNGGNMGYTGNSHGDGVGTWSQQQQQNSPPQQHLHRQQHQQKEQQPQPQPMLEVERAEHHPATLMHTPPSVTYHSIVAEGTGRTGTMEDSRATFNSEDDETETDDTGAPASWWTTDHAKGFSTNGIPLATPPSTELDAFMSPSVSPSSASISLDTFRSRMLHYFPFVHLPAHLTAEQLRIERPFLFRAIVCVTTASAEDKKENSLELKRVLCEMAFLQLSLHQKQQQPQQQQQTVDLLLGLLVYIAWGWEHLLSRRSLSRLLAVATSLAGELRTMDQSVPEITPTIGRLKPKGGFDDAYSSTAATTATAPTAGVANALYLERQRAILGCFVLASDVSAYFSQVDAPRWTPQMDEGLAAIIASGRSAEASCPSDAALAIQVRLQLLAVKAAQVREHAQLPDHPPPETLSPQALLCIKELMGQLQELRASVPPAFQQHFVLLAQTYYTEMCIIGTVYIPQSTHGLQAMPPPPTCGPTRLSSMWQSALAIKSCTSTFLTLSPSGLLGVSLMQWAQLARCVATLHHLSTHHEPGWDPASVRSLVDLPVLLSCTADKLELAAAEAGEQPASADGVFTQLARGLRMSVYHNREPLTQQDEAQRTTEKEDGAGAGADGDGLAAMATSTAAVTVMDANIDELTYDPETGYLTSPTLWLDQFFVDFED